jgi:hypothetical protein
MAHANALAKASGRQLQKMLKNPKTRPVAMKELARRKAMARKRKIPFGELKP